MSASLDPSPADASSSPRRRRGDLAADPEMWQALDEGRLLRAILEHFYERVYADPRLGPFFKHVTREHVVGKQYAFMHDIFTGERTYFGDRPRNAHHWMVIDDALFDHRETLLQQSMHALGLPEVYCRRWRRVDEVFRKQIVKRAPVPKKVGGMCMPVDGVEEVELSVGSMCDACHRAVDVGERMQCHVRTGHAVCLDCVAQPTRAEAAPTDTNTGINTDEETPCV